MKKLFSLIIISYLVLISLPAFAAEKGENKEITGELVDISCYLQMGGKGEGHKDCAIKCAKDGLPVGVLTSKGEVYTIITPSKLLADHMAKEAKISGTLYSGAKAIIPKKMEAKEGDKWVEIKLSSKM